MLETPLLVRSALVHAIGCAVLLTGGGCSPRAEPIEAYTVKKHSSIQRVVEPKADDRPQSIEDPTDRILGAVILIDEIAWYLKGSAPITNWPEGADEKFDQLLTTMKFDDPEKPTWDLADDWTQKPGSSSMRFADLVLGDVTFSVIRLPNTGPTDRQYLLENVNRWRGQLSLGGISSAQLASQSHKIETADGKSALVVNLLGKQDASSMPPMMRGGGMARGPFQGGGGAPSSPANAASKPDQGFSAKAPGNWEPTTLRMFQKARFIVSSGDESGFASASRARGSVMMNVNRWRGQVGVSPLENEDDIDAEKVSVGGVDGLLIRLLGEKQSIVVAMVPLESGESWFFKLEGPTSLVESESDAFLAYLDTVKFN